MSIEYSIITICRNAGNEIGKTIESVCRQVSILAKTEMVIVDGASTDNTLHVVEEYQKMAQKTGLLLRVHSEPDRGIYDAMNKGAYLSNGDWCLYLNAGDIFYDENSLAKLTSSDKHNVEILYGDYVGHWRGRFRVFPARDAEKLTFLGGMEFCHQSSLIEREYLLTHPYTLNYKIAGDFNFFVRAFVHGVRFCHVPGLISIFDYEGVSGNNGLIASMENNEILLTYGLISQEEYNARQINAKRLQMIRSLVPKSLNALRHYFLMRNVTKNWNKELPREEQ